MPKLRGKQNNFLQVDHTQVDYYKTERIVDEKDDIFVCLYRQEGQMYHREKRKVGSESSDKDFVSYLTTSE